MSKRRLQNSPGSSLPSKRRASSSSSSAARTIKDMSGRKSRVKSSFRSNVNEAAIEKMFEDFTDEEDPNIVTMEGKQCIV